MSTKRIPIDEPIDSKNIPWDDGTNAYTGARVEEFIKNSLDSKIGVLHYDTDNNRYIAFADELSKDEYLEDPTKTSLILGVFDAPFNYSASIEIHSATTNAVFLNSIGNYIRFSFDIVNKNGLSNLEDVICTYTFRRGTNKTVVTERYKYGLEVVFNIDKYLLEGLNNITIGIVGLNTLAATTVGVIYQVVNLSLTNTNTEQIITTCYGLTNTQVLAFDYQIAGQGTKLVEFYIDGEQQAEISSDTTTVTSASQSRIIPITNLSDGVHTLQVRAGVGINGLTFYSNLLYREFVVAQQRPVNPLITVALEFDNEAEIKVKDTALTIKNLQQYSVLPLQIGVYTATLAASTDVTIKLDDEVQAVLAASNGKVLNYLLLLSKLGESTLKIQAGNTEKSIGLTISKSSTTLTEITDSLRLHLRYLGKSNTSKDRDTWTYLDTTTSPVTTVSTTFTGFRWDKLSGWSDDGLVIANGNSININQRPLTSASGKTIEIEFVTKNVEEEDAILWDLRNDNGVGLVLSASSIEMHASDGSILDCKFKKEEQIRISIVITGSNTYPQNMALIYVNGIVSRATSMGNGVNFWSNKTINIAGTADAEIVLKQILVYDLALTSNQILNNYILYRDSVDEMLNAYERNNIEEEGSSLLSPDKLASLLPVMIITGDIPTLENTTEKKTYIPVDVEYINMQNPDLSFKLVNAEMSPQGTSSMGYPKKNFKLYTRRRNGTILYDANGKKVESNLYSFKPKAQPVDTWCLKADYAESSGTHNTGIARLWNDVLYNALIDGLYVFRTEAQRIAAANPNFKYDVRTTIDGFPCLLFYKKNEADNLTFIGKYNFNNDKSTESVFGFKDIEGFDNTKMQCWEVLSNTDPIALFLTAGIFREPVNKEDKLPWQDAFEARYPDGGITHYTNGGSTLKDLLRFCLWVNSTKNNPSEFSSTKRLHLDLYKVAAYYVYLMRFGAVDQVVKNAMLTSEDGEHYYFINYDNDTINGLSNEGHLVYSPTIDRDSLDPRFESGTYAYAGHESVLWNNLEHDEEFMNLVPIVDRALAEYGLRYNDVIKVFDLDQASKWCEKIYNLDAEYKYIGPRANLFMLQGSRQSHRRWWLANRFSLYDAKYVSGDYKSNAIELKLNTGSNTDELAFTIQAGVHSYYGWGTNNVVRDSGKELHRGESMDFIVNRNGVLIAVGDPIRIYSAPTIQSLIVKQFIPYLTTLKISEVYSESLGTKLKRLILGAEDTDTSTLKLLRNTVLSNDEFQGLANAKALEELNIRGFEAITSLDLTNLNNFKILKAANSKLISVTFASGAPVTTIELPNTMLEIHFEDLPELTASGVTISSALNIYKVEILNCPLFDALSFINNWMNIKNIPDEDCYLTVNNVNWTFNTAAELLRYGNIGHLDLRGTATISENLDLDTIMQLREAFGENCFNRDSTFFISAPDFLTISAPDSIQEGTSKTTKPTVQVFLLSSVEDLRQTLVVLDCPAGVHVDIKGNYGDDDYQLYIDLYTAPVAWIYSEETGVQRKVKLQYGYGRPGQTPKTRLIEVNILPNIYPSSLSTIEGNVELVAREATYTFNPVATLQVTGLYHLNWTSESPINGDTDISSDVNIIESDNESYRILIPLNILGGSFRIKVDVVKNSTSEVICTIYKNVTYLGADVIMTRNTNAAVLDVLYKNGLCSNNNRLTKQEAEAIQDIGTIFLRKTSITSFDEFLYFTSVTTLEAKAFYECSHLTSIAIPNSVTSIGNLAFYECSGLTSLEIPNSVTSIGTLTFSGCNNLEAFYGKYASDDNRCLIVDGTLNGFAPAGLSSYIIPNSVTSIGYYVFDRCSSLTSVNIPNSVTAIGSSAFSNCSSLTSVTIPNSVTSISSHAFYGCSGLTEVTIPNSVTSIGMSVFSRCSSLTEVTIPESVTSISQSVFYYCNRLTSVTIPNSVTSIGDYVFDSCSSLTSMEIPDSVSSIGRNAFQGCTALRSIKLPNRLLNIKISTFQNSGLKEIEIPATVEAIGDAAFQGCSDLHHIIVKKSIAPTATSSAFGTDENNYTGKNATEVKELYVPTGATGYDLFGWATLIDNCGFTYLATLDDTN